MKMNAKCSDIVVASKKMKILLKYKHVKLLMLTNSEASTFRSWKNLMKVQSSNSLYD